jgi:transcriptional regulator with XRE-family HTH domain
MGDLSARVREYRLKNKMSVRDLAKRAGVSPSYIYAIEAGNRGANIVKLQQIAKALGIPLSTLWGEDSTR